MQRENCNSSNRLGEIVCYYQKELSIVKYKKLSWRPAWPIAARKCRAGEHTHLQATGCGRMTARQIEAARIAMTRYTKRQGKVWIRVFPDKPISKKLPKPVWVKVNQDQITGWLSSNRSIVCMKWMVFLKRLPRAFPSCKSQVAFSNQVRQTTYGIEVME